MARRSTMSAARRCRRAEPRGREICSRRWRDGSRRAILDRLDPKGLGVMGRAQVNGLAGEAKLAAVGTMLAAEDLQEGVPSAVVPTTAVAVDAPEHLQRAEALGDVDGLHRRQVGSRGARAARAAGGDGAAARSPCCVFIAREAGAKVEIEQAADIAEGEQMALEIVTLDITRLARQQRRMVRPDIAVEPASCRARIAW